MTAPAITPRQILNDLDGPYYVRINGELCQVDDQNPKIAILLQILEAVRSANSNIIDVETAVQNSSR